MIGKNINSLIVIQNGQLDTYRLDDRLVWEVGRPSGKNRPDIRLYSATASRRHGRFQNMDGIWFYMDNHGKNGTVYNGKHIEAGLNGRVKPLMLSDGDIFIFGGGKTAVIDHRTIWAMFSTRCFEERWRTVRTEGSTDISFTDGRETTHMENPSMGTVVEQENGLAIYMGDVTYMAGDIRLCCLEERVL